jgi:hypothetical protein
MSEPDLKTLLARMEAPTDSPVDGAPIRRRAEERERAAVRALRLAGPATPPHLRAWVKATLPDGPGPSRAGRNQRS